MSWGSTVQKRYVGKKNFLFSFFNKFVPTISNCLQNLVLEVTEVVHKLYNRSYQAHELFPCACIARGLRAAEYNWIDLLKLVLFRETFHYIFTVRKRSCGKVMFLRACVKNSVHRGWVSTPPADPPGRHSHWADTPLGRQPPQSDGHCSGRYASHWNAFLF